MKAYTTYVNTRDLYDRMVFMGIALCEMLSFYNSYVPFLYTYTRKKYVHTENEYELHAVQYNRIW